MGTLWTVQSNDENVGSQCLQDEMSVDLFVRWHLILPNGTGMFRILISVFRRVIPDARRLLQPYFAHAVCEDHSIERKLNNWLVEKIYMSSSGPIDCEGGLQQHPPVLFVVLGVLRAEGEAWKFVFTKRTYLQSPPSLVTSITPGRTFCVSGTCQPACFFVTHLLAGISNRICKQTVRCRLSWKFFSKIYVPAAFRLERGNVL